MKVFLFYSLFFALLSHSLSAQERPFIWVKNSEREAILSKIEHESWAHSLFEKFKQRLDQDIGDHQSDPADFLSRIPFNWAEQIPGKTPPLKNQYRDHPQEKSDAKIIMQYLQAAIDCGVMYYLVEDERYAQCALDILNAFIQGDEDLTHRRAVFFVDKRYFVIVDEAYGNALGEVDLHFQLTPGGMIMDDDWSLRTDFEDGWNLLIVPEMQNEMLLEKEFGQVSFIHTQKQERPAFRYSLAKRSEQDRIRFVTLLVPYQEVIPSVRFKVVGDSNPGTSDMSLS